MSCLDKRLLVDDKSHGRNYWPRLAQIDEPPIVLQKNRVSTGSHMSILYGPCPSLAFNHSQTG